MKQILIHILIFSFLFIKTIAFSQGAKGKQNTNQNNYIPVWEKLPCADANRAIEIKDFICGPFNVSKGFGEFKEMRYNSYSREMYEEDHSAWFKFIARKDTTVSFDIVPFNRFNDYDFLLFKCTGGNCDSFSNYLSIVRSCRSACSSKSGLTGLSEYATKIFIAIGQGPAYAASINVKKGETYFLLVNFAAQYFNLNKPPEGFMIYFNDNYSKRKPIVLNNISFETGNAILQKESFSELDKLALELEKSQMVIEIRGHTDNIGSKEKNQQLSEDRAKAVMDYLLSKNINKKRLFFKGFGSTAPLTSNSTVAGRQKNRRVEFIKVMY